MLVNPYSNPFVPQRPPTSGLIWIAISWSAFLPMLITSPNPPGSPTHLTQHGHPTYKIPPSSWLSVPFQCINPILPFAVPSLAGSNNTPVALHPLTLPPGKHTPPLPPSVLTPLKTMPNLSQFVLIVGGPHLHTAHYHNLFLTLLTQYGSALIVLSTHPFTTVTFFVIFTHIPHCLAESQSLHGGYLSISHHQQFPSSSPSAHQHFNPHLSNRTLKHPVSLPM